MGTKIRLKDEQVIIRKYKVRRTGKGKKTLETSIPREAFDREARKLGLLPEKAIDMLDAVWRYNSFDGLHLSFERKSP